MGKSGRLRMERVLEKESAKIEEETHAAHVDLRDKTTRHNVFTNLKM